MGLKEENTKMKVGTHQPEFSPDENTFRYLKKKNHVLILNAGDKCITVKTQCVDRRKKQHKQP